MRSENQAITKSMRCHSLHRYKKIRRENKEKRYTKTIARLGFGAVMRRGQRGFGDWKNIGGVKDEIER